MHLYRTNLTVQKGYVYKLRMPYFEASNWNQNTDTILAGYQ